MKIEKELQEDRQAKLTVEYTQEAFEGFKRRAAKKIAKSTKIPGFRPGKAPYQVIVNHYGEGAILQEAIDILLDDDYAKMLDEAELEPSGPGNLESIESYDPPRFVFMVPLEPEVNLGDYREIRKAYELEEFDVKEVEQFIENMRRNAATIIPSEEAAGEGDLVYFTLSAEFLNPAEDEDASITDKTPQQVVIPTEAEESYQEWPYSGFARTLLGVKAGEVKEFQHTYSEDHEDEEYRGKTAVFTVEVQSVKKLELPEFDEDFVKTLGNYDTPEAFKENIEARLREEHQNNYDQTYFDALLKEITEGAEINYPPQMLEHEEEHVLEDIKTRLQNQKMEFDTYLKLRETDEAAFVEKEVRPVAKERLERSLIVDTLIEQEGLKLDEKKLKATINQVLTEVFYSGNADEMQKEMGNEAFSRAISMEGVQRTMNDQLMERLKLIATGQPIPAESEPEEAVTVLEDAETEAEQPETIEEIVEEIVEIAPAADVEDVQDDEKQKEQNDSIEAEN